MKNIKFGNMLDVTSGLIVHGCNAHGVMGSGIAASVKAKWPKCFNEYTSYIQSALASRTDISVQRNLLGTISYYFPEDNENLIIANAITQLDYGRDPNIRYVSYAAVQKAFSEIALFAQESGIEVHYPLLGAGLGGGDWVIISDIIESCFARYPEVVHTLWIYES